MTYKEESDHPALLRLSDDAYGFLDDDVIMLKVVDGHDDPVELTAREAIKLATWLADWATRLDRPEDADRN